MPSQCNIFYPGEWVMIAKEPHMREALQIYRNRDEVIRALKSHIGEKVRIVGYSFPHGDGVLYKLQGIEQEVWEECLIDWTICPDDPNNCAASEFYRIQIEKINGERYITIRDREGRLFHQSWHSNPEMELSGMLQVASARNRGAFEVRYGFGRDIKSERK